MVDREQVEKLVREKLTNRLGNVSAPSDSAPKNTTKSLDFVNEHHLRELPPGTKVLTVTPKAIITPLARDLAEGMGVQFQVLAAEAVATVHSLNPKSIALGCDHGGFEMKQALKKELQTWGYEVVDVGTNSAEAVDYPDYAHAVATMVARNECALGVMIDGAGIGSAMVANKVPGIRAAHCSNISEIKNSREHNHANVLTLGGRLLGIGLATDMLKAWLETPFAGGRHQKRIDKITAVEQLYIKRS